jgi:hypothetical protein
MMREDGLHVRRPGLIAKPVISCLLLTLLCLSDGFSQAKHAAAKAEKPERTVVSSEDVVLYAPAGGASFAFMPKGAFHAFDRNLTLSSAPGETRSYLLKTREGAEGETRLVAYVIDKRRPRSPRAKPATGLYHETLEPELTSDPGSTVMWSIVGTDGSGGDFRPYSPASRPRLSPPAAGSISRTLVAYAVNDAGVRSYPSSFLYRMAEPGLPASPPRASDVALSADPSLAPPRIDIQRGYAELSMPIAVGSSMLADFSVASAPASLDDFERLQSSDGVARLRIPCPYGWAGEVKLYFGTLNSGTAYYNPEPITVALAYPAEDLPAPVAPPSPILAAEPSGQTGFLAFPAYDGSIFVSVNGAEPRPYSTPIPLSDGSGALRLSWYGEDSEGRKSTIQEGVFSLPGGLRDIELAGVADGASVAGDVVLRPDAKSLALLAASKGKAGIRYELRIDGSFPPEPGPASPALGDSLSISCPPGEERSVVLRYRIISGDEASEGKILRFFLDRKPPEAPRAVEQPSPYSDEPTSLELEPGKGGADVFASVAADGESGPFRRVEGPLQLPGSEEGPVAYVIRSYDVDAAGNRSPEMERLAIVVDTTSVYVAENGDDRGDGTPSKPYRSLDAAIAAAAKGGKKNVNMRGALELRAPVSISRSICLVGGFDGAWGKDAALRASLKVAIQDGQTAIGVRGGELFLKRLDLRSEAMGAGALVDLDDSTLTLVDSDISAGAEGDAILVSARDSRIDLNGSQIKATKAMSFTAFSAERCSISMSESSILSSKDVRIFGAFDCEGGSLSIRQSLLESDSDLGLSLLSMRAASLLVDRSVLSARGGSGFLRFGLFRAVSGEVKNSKLMLAWNGPATLFEIADGGPSFRHDTVSASSAKGGLTFFDVRGKPIQLWNSVFNCAGREGTLLRSDSPLKAGDIAADCVWGFEYLVGGACEARDPQAVNSINASSPVFSSKPMVAEPPEKTFDSALKSQSPLRKGSACIGGALSLGSGYESDFNGRPRPSPGKAAPDMGADEFLD